LPVTINLTNQADPFRQPRSKSSSRRAYSHDSKTRQDPFGDDETNGLVTHNGEHVEVILNARQSHNGRLNVT
jgi:hypothetical protein